VENEVYGSSVHSEQLKCDSRRRQKTLWELIGFEIPHSSLFLQLLL
jgi:hypothetical protein